jgi:hypothetical protein
MKHRHPALLIGSLLSVSFTVFAQTPPPVAPLGAGNEAVTMTRPPSTGLRMGAFAVRFEKTTLGEVRRVASAGDIAQRGDAGERAYWLCYTNVGATQDERIWLVADGEMGGAEHHVTDVSAELLPEGGATVDCPALPDKLKPVSLDNRLWLGASEAGATGRLGASSHPQGAWRSYGFRGKLPGKCAGGGFDLSAWLLLRFQNGRVNALQAGQVTSC